MSDPAAPDAPASPGRRIDETLRAAVLEAHEVDSLRDDAVLRQVTDFAAALCDAPVALVSLVERHRQTFLARTGLDATETTRDVSFCAHAMLGGAIMVVPDATKDPRFLDNPLVTGAPHIRFYAGAPLVSRDGIPLGALCVIDTRPRDGLSALQRQGLLVLAADVAARLNDNRSAAASRAAIDDSEGRFRTLADTMPQMVWSTLPDGYHDYYNARWYEATGMPAGSTDGVEWNGVIHPDDRDRAWSVWRHSLETGDPYQIEYRLRHADGSYRWTLGRALPMRDDGGTILRWFGTCTDVHEQKEASEEREIIAQELSHRIKNIFSVIVGLIAFAARTTPGFSPVADDLRARVTALGRAHDFVRPHSMRSRPAAAPTSLHGLLADLFRPYQSVDGSRITIDGSDVEIDDRSATPLALMFHELATNATKYGALSVDTGHIAVHSAIAGDRVVLSWRESGGPPVTHRPATKGFGSQLLDLSVSRQLGGTIDHLWAPDGLVVRAAIPTSAFSRS